MENKFKPEVDVAVLLLFFTRTDITARTFEQIRKARPSRLYLYQDGPRQSKPDDTKNIQQCREAVESAIDWDCEVHRLYQKENFGCDPSEFISQKWMFETETKGIVIEDDDVMSVSFFRYCKELLDKYEYDNRINIICGMNHLGVYGDCPYDYFFSQGGGAIWGWATWKRVIDQWDPKYKLLEDHYFCKLLERRLGSSFYKQWMNTCRMHIDSKKEHYESILALNDFKNGGYNIVPKKNMTCNIGVSADSTHCVSDISKLPRKVRGQMYMKTYEMEFPLNHPEFIMDDLVYKEKWNNIIRGTWLERTLMLRRFERLFLRLFSFLIK